jgi:hypothetical protein
VKDNGIFLFAGFGIAAILLYYYWQQSNSGAVSGWFTSDCSSGTFAFIDPGCIVNTEESTISGQITQVVLILVVAVIVIVALAAFSPNTKYFVPRL